MVTKTPLQEPDNNPTPDKCDITILGIRRTVLKIDLSHIEERNKEFRSSKKKKIKENLDQFLLDKKVIKDFVQQIREEDMWPDSVSKSRNTLKSYGCYPIIDKRNGMNYLMIFLLDDKCPELIRVRTVYPHPLHKIEAKIKKEKSNIPH